MARAALRVAGPRGADPDRLPRGPERLRQGRHRRLPRDHDPRLEDAEGRREVGLRRGPRPACQGPRGDPAGQEDPALPVELDPGPAGQQHPQRRVGGHRLPPGEVLAYVGSASYTSKGGKKFQPQFDVLADGWRQPGSAIKPIDYAIGIEDETMTASTMFMDVVTDFGKGFTPTQADDAERGPVRLRSALQFSLNVPAIKATIMQGLEHTFERTKDFGLVYPSTANPVLSMGIGTLETHPIDLLGAYGAIANGGVLMPRQMITKVVDEDGRQVWPLDDGQARGHPGHQPAGRLHRHRHPGRQHPDEGQPVLGQVRDQEGRQAPAGGLQDRHDQRQPRRARLRLPGPAQGPEPAGPRGGRLDGQQRQRPEQGQPVARLVRAAVVGDPDRGQRRPRHRAVPIAGRPRDGDRRRVHRPQARARSRRRRSRSCSCRARSRPSARRSASRSRSTRRPGLLWQDGCVGPKVTKGFFDLTEVESNFPAWQKANRLWGARAAKGPGTRGGPEGTRTSYFYDGSFAPFGKSWGAPFAPRRALSAGTAADARRPCLPGPSGEPVDLRHADAAGRRERQRADARNRRRSPDPSGRVRGQKLTIVAPSPPSPRSPGRTDPTSGWPAAASRTASRRAPVPRPWMIVTLPSPARPASSR